MLSLKSSSLNFLPLAELASFFGSVGANSIVGVFTGACTCITICAAAPTAAGPGRAPRGAATRPGTRACTASTDEHRTRSKRSMAA
eukprot:scaffold8036_cov128-Isochrysis_galbana.AAC.2